MMSRLRKRLGALRTALVHGRSNRRLAEAAAIQRADWMDATAWTLPSLPPAPQTAAVEVHSLCGAGQVGMGLWSSWSLMRFLPAARFVLHSDGSLTPDMIARWQAILPGMRVVTADDSLAAMEIRLAQFPRVLAWSKSYHFGFKLGGLHCSAGALKIIDMDTDVMVLSDPEGLKRALADPDWTMAWNVGQQYSYAYPEAVLREVLGPLLVQLPARLNGGFLMATQFGDAEWGHLEEVLAQLEGDARIDPLRYWMHQTLIALVASQRGTGARPLPPEYTIYSGATRPNTVARHFVGNPGVRPRFFTEGVPAMVADARARGQLPEGFADTNRV